MKILNFRELSLCKDFITAVTNTKNEEVTVPELPKNTFLSKLKIHNIVIEKNKDVLRTLLVVTKNIVKNSKLDINDDIIIMLCVAAFSASVLKNNSLLKDNNIEKQKFEIETKSILEELKLSGIGNNIVKKLSNIFNILIKYKNSFNSILKFIEENKISINELRLIIDHIKNTKSNSIFSINEFKI